MKIYIWKVDSGWCDLLMNLCSPSYCRTTKLNQVFVDSLYGQLALTELFIHSWSMVHSVQQVQHFSPSAQLWPPAERFTQVKAEWLASENAAVTVWRGSGRDSRCAADPSVLTNKMHVDLSGICLLHVWKKRDFMCCCSISLVWRTPELFYFRTLPVWCLIFN